MERMELDEPVKVRADFQGGKIRPVLIRRGTRLLRVREVHSRWQDREGQFPRYFFSVSLETGDVAQLCLRTQDMVWYLEAVRT